MMPIEGASDSLFQFTRRRARREFVIFFCFPLIINPDLFTGESGKQKAITLRGFLGGCTQNDSISGLVVHQS